jgi:hypothetical protein
MTHPHPGSLLRLNSRLAPVLSLDVLPSRHYHFHCHTDRSSA